METNVSSRILAIQHKDLCANARVVHTGNGEREEDVVAGLTSEGLVRLMSGGDPVEPDMLERIA